MYRILIQQAAVHKLPDHLCGDAALTEIGENPSVIRVAERQGKLLFRADRLWLRNGRVSGFPMEGQKVLHRFRKGFSAKLLEEGNGIPPVFWEYRNQVRRSLIRRLSISVVVWKRPTRLT